MSNVRKLIYGTSGTGKKTINFPEAVAFLDSLKTAYYLAKASCEKYFPDRPAADAFIDALRGLEGKSLEDAMTLAEQNQVLKWLMSITDIFDVEEPDDPLLKEFHRILTECETHDMKFYHEAGYGEFWNEVPLPEFINDLFYDVECTLRETCPDLVDSRRNDEFEDGMVAISYYDLSGIWLVFRDMSAAKAFDEQNGVEPSDYLERSGDFWYSC